MTVVYRLEQTGHGPEVAERLLTQRCPTCGADWTVAGAVLPRPGGHRTFRCEACGDHHAATQVDEHGRPVAARWST